MSHQVLHCLKHGDSIPQDRPACPYPREPCKYRSDCVVFALGRDMAEGETLAAAAAAQELTK